MDCLQNIDPLHHPFELDQSLSILMSLIHFLLLRNFTCLMSVPLKLFWLWLLKINLRSTFETTKVIKGSRILKLRISHSKVCLLQILSYLLDLFHIVFSVTSASSLVTL